MTSAVCGSVKYSEYVLTCTESSQCQHAGRTGHVNPSVVWFCHCTNSWGPAAHPTAVPDTKIGSWILRGHKSGWNKSTGDVTNSQLNVHKKIKKLRFHRHFKVVGHHHDLPASNINNVVVQYKKYCSYKKAPVKFMYKLFSCSYFLYMNFIPCGFLLASSTGKTQSKRGEQCDHVQTNQYITLITTSISWTCKRNGSGILKHMSSIEKSQVLFGPEHA